MHMDDHVAHAELSLAEAPPLFDPAVWLVAVICLTLGALYAWTSVVRQHEVKALDGAVRLELPARWTFEESEGVYEAHLPSLGKLGPSLQIRPIAAPEEGITPKFIDMEVAKMDEARSESGQAYRVLKTEDRRAFGGHKSAWSYAALVQDPPGAGEGAAVLPEVMEGVDILVTTRGGRVYHVAAWAPAPWLEDPDHPLGDALRSIVFKR